MTRKVAMSGTTPTTASQMRKRWRCQGCLAAHAAWTQQKVEDMASKSGSRLRLSPAARLALGLVILTACLLFSVDHILGVVPDQAAAGFTVHQRTGANLAIQLAPLVERQDFELIERLLHTASGRNPDLLSLGLRDQSGTLVAQTENHRHAWIAPPDNQSAMGNVIVPIKLNMARWGQ